MPTRFIVLSTQRTGSTWVIDMLNSHPRVRAYSELFILGATKDRPTWAGPKDVLLWNAYWRRVPWKLKGMVKPYYYRKYLDDVYRVRDGGVRAIGFKLMYSQVRHHPMLVGYVALRRPAIVHLMRRNLLDMILSAETALVRGGAHARGAVEQVRVRLKVSNLVRKLERMDEQVQWARHRFSALALPYMEVIYEDLLSGEASFGSILDFLGVPPGEGGLATSLKRLSKGGHRETIENYEAVRESLSETRYSSMLR